MIENPHHFFNLIILLDVVLAICCAYLISQLPVRYAFKFVTIPLLLVVVYLSVVHFEDVLGRPYDAIPKTKFAIKSYRIVKQKDEQPKIEIWAIETAGKSRLYVVPYDDKIAKMLAEAMNKTQKGRPQAGEFKQMTPKSGHFNYEFRTEDIPVESFLPPKDE